MRLFRFEVVESFLSGGIALAKVDALRPLLEKYGHRLTNRAHLSELIPAVLENEKDKLKKELKDVKEASVIFDGTARLGEALAVIVRYVQENFQPTQRLIRLDILAKALKGEELAQRLMSCLAVDYHFGPTAIIGGMRDGASVNGAALRQLMFFYPKLFDVVCFSHTIYNVGNHFEFKILDLFARYWISMFSHSYNARLVWRERTGQSIRTFSETRWWSKWEVLRQVSEYFGDVEPFLRENDEVSQANRRRLLEIFDDPQSCQDLRLELAALVDAGVHFVNATYYLEGDGPLIFTCYERLSAVSCSGRKLPEYHSCCSGNCWWQCCALQSINGTGESLYPARLPILSREVQCPVSRYSTSFQSCAPLLPCTGASPESDSCFTGRAQKLSLRQ